PAAPARKNSPKRRRALSRRLRQDGRILAKAAPFSTKSWVAASTGAAWSAHTRGDVLVHLPADKILYTGDLLFVGGHPVLWAGPIENWIKACDYILSLDVDVIVPGHGPIAEKPAVR